MSSIAQLQFLMKGGFMMLPLLLSGLIALVVVIDRLWLLKKKLHTASADVDQVLQLVRAGETDKALQQVQSSTSPVLSVLAAGLRETGAEVSEIELSMQNQAEMWVPVMEKRLDILDTVITAAPLMGLLGTITGMMGSFQVLSEKGVNEPGAITGGVAEALIATATGLVIALVTLVFYNYLNQTVKDLIFQVENGASRLVEAIKARARSAR